MKDPATLLNKLRIGERNMTADEMAEATAHNACVQAEFGNLPQKPNPVEALNNARRAVRDAQQ